MSGNIPLHPYEVPNHNELRNIGPNDHHPAFTKQDHALIDHKNIPGVPSIDDENISNLTTWSSQKISSLIVSNFESIIDDNSVSPDLTWSSQKISNELSNKIDITTADSNYEKLSNKGQPNGYCPLDSNGKIDTQYLQLNSLTFAGDLDASTGVYPSDPVDQTYYRITVAGNINGVDYQVGDWAVYINSTVGWTKIDNTDTVRSVNGKTGDVQLTSDDIADGVNVIFEKTSNKGVANGYCPLDSSGKISSQYLPSSTTSLQDLTDTQITNVSNGQILVYNSGTGKWENQNYSSGGNFVRTDGDSYPTQDATFNIGDSTHRFNNIYSVYFQGTATSALYADLAEKYISKDELEVGDVVVVSKDKDYDIEKSSEINSQSVLGVVSENPGFIMNSKLENGICIALTGKIKCKVTGKVNKSDLLISYKNGTAISYNYAKEIGLDIEHPFKLGLANEYCDCSLDEFKLIDIIAR